MASPQVGSVPAKLSFAKILAMPAPNAVKPSPNSPQKPRRPAEDVTSPEAIQNNVLKSPLMTCAASEATVNKPEVPTDVGVLTGAIEGLALVREASLEQKASKVNPGGDSTEDDQSHLSNSSSKPQSFDTKSLASVTTFAMDEKESIRPDDSASVRAADEEDLILGTHLHSGAQGTAEQAVIAARANPRFGANAVTIAARRYPTLTLTNPPRFGDLPVSPVLDAEDATASNATAPPPIEDAASVPRFPSLVIAPDEKLLEALATPKDRLPLLQLEERVLAFVSQTRDTFLDLPPQNSFTRLLAHKLADYYNLEHHINDDNSAVRMYRTACCTLPTPLSIIAQSIPIGPPPPPGAASFKIMRRAGYGARQFSIGGSTPASSSVPSKATSENGGDNSDEGLASPLDRTPAKDKSKLTREEREIHYKAARERIFSDFQEPIPSETASTGDTSASISRSSSSSGKRKTRRQKTPKDDSFEARSSFVPGYPGMPMNSIPTPYHTPFPEQPYHSQYSNAQGAMIQAPNYGSTPTQNYPGFESAMVYNSAPGYIPNPSQQYASPETWSAPQSPPPGSFYNFGNVNQPSHPFPQHSSTVPPQMMSAQYGPSNTPNIPQGNQIWMAPAYPNQYQPSPSMVPNSQPTQWPNYAPSPGVQPVPPYQYGQLPPQSFGKPSSYSSQHPVPGSFNRSLFNPQTRAFVPSNAPSRAGGRNNRKKGANAPNLMRNGSTTGSLGSENAPVSSVSLRGPGAVNGGNIASPKPREDSLQQRYGAPAHLPKKPPPSEVPSAFDLDGATMGSHQGGPLVVNGAVGAA